MNFRKFLATTLSAALCLSASFGTAFSASSEISLTLPDDAAVTELKCTGPVKTNLKAYIGGEEVKNGQEYEIPYDKSNNYCWLEMEYENDIDEPCDFEGSELVYVRTFKDKDENGRRYVYLYARKPITDEYVTITDPASKEMITIKLSTPEKIGNYPVKKSTDITVTVVDSITKMPVENAEVFVSHDGEREKYSTDKDGKFDTKTYDLTLDYLFSNSRQFTFGMENYPEGYNFISGMSLMNIYIREDMENHYDVKIYIGRIDPQYKDVVTSRDPYGNIYDEKGSLIYANGTAHIASPPKTTVTTTETSTGNATGLTPTTAETTASGTGSATTPLFEVAGDANCDRTLNMADVVTIMQFMVNPDKFPMSAEGRKAADVIGNDGVTNLDALRIQKILLGLV